MTSAVSRNKNHLRKSGSSNLKSEKGADVGKAENLNFYDKPKSRKDSKGKVDAEGRPINSKDMLNLNSDLNSFRSQHNESADQQNNTQGSDTMGNQLNQLYESASAEQTAAPASHQQKMSKNANVSGTGVTFPESDAAGGGHIPPGESSSAGRMKSGSLPGEALKNITRNRNYMNSDVGTTIIENEKGEEQSVHGDKNPSKESEEKDTMEQQVKILSNATRQDTATVGSYNKLLYKSDSNS